LQKQEKVIEKPPSKVQVDKGLDKKESSESWTKSELSEEESLDQPFSAKVHDTGNHSKFKDMIP
jgi:hypothetical protein